MTSPDRAEIDAALDATWPAAARIPCGPFLLREGRGGGKRVSAATATGPVSDTDIPLAEAGMAALDQPALFMIREGDAALDATLAARGYVTCDPVAIYLAPTASLARPPEGMRSFPIWTPLSIMLDIWAENGFGPGRHAVMERVEGPKTAILGRVADRPAGATFVAIHGRIAALHAMVVVPGLRRQGTADNILRAAAVWAQDHGAEWLALAVTQDNAAARQLYASHGMDVVGQYHYRIKEPQRPEQ